MQKEWYPSVWQWTGFSRSPIFGWSGYSQVPMDLHPPRRLPLGNSKFCFYLSHYGVSFLPIWTLSFWYMPPPGRLNAVLNDGIYNTPSTTCPSKLRRLVTVATSQSIEATQAIIISVMIRFTALPVVAPPSPEMISALHVSKACHPFTDYTGDSDAVTSEMLLPQP